MARAVHNEDHDFFTSDEELLSDSRDVEASTMSRRQSVLLALGSLALLGCVTMTYSLWAPMPTSDRKNAPIPAAHTARTLMESEDFAELATSNIMRARSDYYGPSDRARVRAQVNEGIAHARKLLTNNPHASSTLDSVRLSAEERGAVFKVLGHITDPRVQRLGLHVAHAVQSSPSENPAIMKEHIIKSMQQDLPEVRKLSNEIIPAQVRHLWASSAQDWDMDLNAEKVRILKSFGKTWEERLNPSRTHTQQPRRLQVYASTTAPTGGAALVKSEEALGIVTAVVDQLRAMWDIMRPMAKIFGKDINMNVWATSGVGAGAAVFKLVSCALDGVADGYNMVELASCPLQVGSEGMDAIRGMLAMMGVLGDNNPKNGEQGAHNGEAEESESSSSSSSSSS